MNAESARLRLLEAKIRVRVPGFRNEGKGSSSVQKVIGVLLFFLKYMTDFVSTFYPVVYWPSMAEYRSHPVGSFKTLAHEYVHLLDTKAHPIGFRLGYMWPQLLAVLSLLALVAIFHSIWWLLSLSAIAALLPLPASWRMKYELRGYAMSMAVNAWRNGTVLQNTKNWIIDVFAGPSYWFMWPFRKGMEKRIDAVERAITNGDVLLWSAAFIDVKEICDLSDEEAVKAVSRLRLEAA